MVDILHIKEVFISNGIDVIMKSINSTKISIKDFSSRDQTNIRNILYKSFYEKKLEFYMVCLTVELEVKCHIDFYEEKNQNIELEIITQRLKTIQKILQFLIDFLLINVNDMEDKGYEKRYTNSLSYLYTIKRHYTDSFPYIWSELSL